MSEKIINSPNKRRKRKKKKMKYFFRRLLFLITVFFVIWYFNNFTIKVSTTQISSEKISSPIRIAVMSDYHAKQYGISPEKVIKKLKTINPDAVFYLGDMYCNDDGDEEISIAESLMINTAKDGYTVFFVPGEHDRSLSYLNKLMQNGVHVMNYQTSTVNIKGNNIKIYGIDNAYFSDTFDLSSAFTLDENTYNILMAHIPMYEYYDDFGADLTVCGDTHGGVIQLPFGLGCAFYSATGEWFPEIKGKRDDIYDKGLFSMSSYGKYMYITSGLGNYPVAFRLNNRPEIAVIDIS